MIKDEKLLWFSDDSLSSFPTASTVLFTCGSEGSEEKQFFHWEVIEIVPPLSNIYLKKDNLRSTSILVHRH